MHLYNLLIMNYTDYIYRQGRGRRIRSVFLITNVKTSRDLHLDMRELAKLFEMKEVLLAIEKSYK